MPEPLTAEVRQSRMREFMRTQSKASLEGLQLDRWDRVSKLRRELKEIIEDWVECEVEARLAARIKELRFPSRIGPSRVAADGRRQNNLGEPVPVSNVQRGDASLNAADRPRAKAG